MGYLISLTSRSADEAHIRALLLQGVAAGDLALRGLDSRDVNGTGQVIVNAHLIAHSRVDAAVENIVGRLGLEQTICAARWQVQTSLDLDHQSSTLSDAAGLVPPWWSILTRAYARPWRTLEPGSLNSPRSRQTKYCWRIELNRLVYMIESSSRK